MCDQDEAFFEAYDKQYASRNIQDSIKKTIRMMDKIPEADNSKGKITTEEETLLRK